MLFKPLTTDVHQMKQHGIVVVLLEELDCAMCDRQFTVI